VPVIFTLERMEDFRRSLARLVDVLGGIAMYNDKGHVWSRDAPERIAMEQAKAQAEIDHLLSVVGEGHFSEELMLALKSGPAVRDSSGAFRSKVAEYLESPRNAL
jgi:hypothetical protein